LFESCDHIEGLVGCIVVGFCFGRRDVPDGAEQAIVVEHGVIAVRLAPAILL
jgi:hypothetical protein